MNQLEQEIFSEMESYGWVPDVSQAQIIIRIDVADLGKTPQIVQQLSLDNGRRFMRRAKEERAWLENLVSQDVIYRDLLAQQHQASIEFTEAARKAMPMKGGLNEMMEMPEKKRLTRLQTFVELRRWSIMWADNPEAMIIG